MPIPSSLRHPAPWAWAATALLATVLCILTLSPQTSTVARPSPDKLYHFIGFGALALPLCLAFPRHAWAVILGVAAFGAAVEIIQPIVGRGAEWGDLLADMLGAATAAGVAVALRRRWPKPV